MPAIVEFPTVVKEVLDAFASFFANEPERRHFAEYLTGLILAHKKNVSAINREFAVTTDQSCLNRWITAPAGVRRPLGSALNLSLKGNAADSPCNGTLPI